MGYSGEGPQKVIIFDWDDTICPSSFFDRQQMENMDDLPASVSGFDFDWASVFCGRAQRRAVRFLCEVGAGSGRVHHRLSPWSLSFSSTPRITKCSLRLQNVLKNAYGKLRNMAR